MAKIQIERADCQQEIDAKDLQAYVDAGWVPVSGPAEKPPKASVKRKPKSH